MSLIHINDVREPIDAGRHFILEAALDAGVPLPHGCSAGECGSCKCELLAGEVRMDTYSPEALTAEESAVGLILACRARPLGDVHIRTLQPAVLPPVVTVQACVSCIDHVAHDVVELTLFLDEQSSFVFRPGQFARLHFNNLPARSYSMANGPAQGHLKFHVRVLPEGQVSQYVANSLQYGEMVEVQGPFGDAYWRQPTDGPLLLLAGGTGLAPILSVLHAALEDGQATRQIHVYHGVRTETDLYAGDLLRQQSRDSNFRFVPVYSEASDPKIRGAHLHEAVADDFDALDDATIFVCGPPPMVEAVKALAKARGVLPDRIWADAFYPALPERKSLWQRITSAVRLAA